MRIDEKVQGDVLVFKLSGDLDSFSVTTARERMSRHIESGVYNIVVDLAEIEFMDSAGLRQLVGTLQVCMHRGGDLVLVGANETVRDLLRITRLDTVFRTFETVEGAVDALSG